MHLRGAYNLGPNSFGCTHCVCAVSFTLLDMMFFTFGPFLSACFMPTKHSDHGSPLAFFCELFGVGHLFHFRLLSFANVSQITLHAPFNIFRLGPHSFQHLVNLPLSYDPHDYDQPLPSCNDSRHTHDVYR
ncbi:hypothetical protein JAAARDRAFT_371306 [Jaapia argillacea MUCL 33604]|uniref:Uncharacterized protein n=1 Tax=Jaapia argillacea MUCL 33604 TaxID=933084 RepID=A0A067Q843_9AGAM|nr:hypothetical protein JAAARDRAFT_371306 [Jaapia argillacea MUCL 33604]